MNDEQKQAYDWAKNHDYPSIAARYARSLATVIDDLQSQLSESQQETRAAVEDLESLMRKSKELCACTYCRTDQSWGCALHRTPPMCTPKWRGPQEAGKGEAE